jgi:coenzyme F420-0:L-glutamate ligase/coenzyme F420-1:gamma-L-glutamate ligase
MSARRIIYTALPGIPMVNPGDDLSELIDHALKEADLTLQSGDILVLAQKIVSKSENRYINLNDISPSERARDIALIVDKDARLVEVILSESQEILRQRKGVLIVVHRLGYIMANAGVDQSNIDHRDGVERVLLLPRDPDDTCRRLKTRLDAMSGCNIGVIINDSFGRPWRNGVTGVALGTAGIPSLHSLIGQPDLFGRPLRVSEIAVADELAAGASLVMGQADEGCPVVHVRGYVAKAAENSAQALIRPKHMDLFR